MTNPIEMDAATFATWAEETFDVDCDNVSLWDMQRDLSSKARMPAEFEVKSSSNIPAELYDILMERKVRRVIVRTPFRSTPDRSEWEARDGTAE